MSTRAIITVKGSSEFAREAQRLYAHGDGYPSHVGIMVHNFLKVAPSLAGGGKVQSAAWGSGPKPGRYRAFSGVGRAYATMHNVLGEPDKFVPALISYMTNKGYGGLYLTDRDPEEEIKGDGYTDIKWHYLVTLGPRPKLDAYEFDFSKKQFVKQSASIPELAEKEQIENRKRAAEYEKAKAKEKKPKTSRKASTGIRSLRA